jgi:enoyl-CoA hydratase/carnithine racemase
MTGLRVEHPRDGVALVVIDRPDRMNAFDDDLLLDALPDVFADLATDRDARVVVVTGEGRAFSSGADLDCSGFRQETATEAEAFVRRTHRTPVAVRRLGKPSIAAVNGAAVGAGFGLALACDVRLAGPHARMGAPFITMGLVPDYGVSYFLPRIVGPGRALQLLLSARLIDASEALQLGLVSSVEDDVVTAALDLAGQWAGLPPAAVSMTRTNLWRAMELDIEAEILEQEARAQAVALKGSEFADLFAKWAETVQGASPARLTTQS